MYLSALLAIVTLCILVFSVSKGLVAWQRHIFLKAAPGWHRFLYDTSGWRRATSVDCQHLMMRIGGAKYELIESCPSEWEEPSYSLIIDGLETREEIRDPVSSPYIADLFAHHTATART